MTSGHVSPTRMIFFEELHKRCAMKRWGYVGPKRHGLPRRRGAMPWPRDNILETREPKANGACFRALSGNVLGCKHSLGASCGPCGKWDMRCFSTREVERATLAVCCFPIRQAFGWRLVVVGPRQTGVVCTQGETFLEGRADKSGAKSDNAKLKIAQGSKSRR
jgi:hypothetical protein